MNILDSTITIGSWELPWTLETALFWLLFAIVCITLFMVIVFGILLRRIGKNRAVAVVQAAEAEEPEKVEYGIILHGPENLPAIQVALYNGSNQIGLAVPVRDSAATILAVPGDYTVKIFGLPDNYDFTAGVVSPENHTAEVKVEQKPEVVTPPYEIRYVPETQPEPEKVEYTVNVEAPEDLPALQVALFNGENQIGSAVTLADGCAKILAVPGDYTVKIFGLPDNYDFTTGVASSENHTVEVKVEQKPEVVTPPYEIRYVPEAQPEPEKAEYTVNVEAPEDLPALQVALFNGENQIGSAVTLADGCAKILAVPGDYTVKIFGLPDNYDFTAGIASSENHTVEVKVEQKPEVVTPPYEIRYVPEAQPEPEKAEYTVNVEAPEDLPTLHIALFNGENQIGSAVTLADGCAKISAVPGDYTVKIFGLPEGYSVDSGVLSATTLEASVKITEIIPEEAEEEIVPVSDEPVPEEEVEYNVVVTAPDGLPAIQVALFNGETQVGSAVNIESGAATLVALPGDYTVKLFGVPEGYDITAGTLSESRHICNITVTPPKSAPAPAPADKEEKQDRDDEEAFEGGTLRYDKSFTARLIQSERETKSWYTNIKNELLSYKRVHDRMSWKRESYNLGRQAFARMSFRGNTLCLYLPLDPNAFADSKYKVESVEDNITYVDTPCLYRIKNDRRAKYASELIAMVAQNMQAEKFERESVDYYLPYEGLVELINKKLIKRVIKFKHQEAFFTERKQADLLASLEEQELYDRAENESEVEDSEAEETAAEETVAAEPVVEETTVEETVAAEPVVEETVVEEPAVEETTVEETVVEEPVVEETVEETVVEQPVVEETAVEEPVVEEPAVEETAAEETVAAEPVVEEAVEETVVEQPVVEETVEETVAAEPAVEETAVEETAAAEPEAEEVTIEVEGLSQKELYYIQSYIEEAKDDDGIDAVGAMFRRRGKKVYWFAPDGKTWERGEIAIFKSHDNPPQEVIVVDIAKISPSKLHLPLKPLSKLNRRS